jgi:hypothetical protein
MSDILQWGPFVIRADWFYYGLSALLGFTLSKYFIKRNSGSLLPYLDYLFNALLVALFIWKLTPILTEPQLLKNPFKIILYPGTALGTRLAAAGTILYLIYTVWKLKLEWRAMMDIFSIFIISSVSVYSMTHWQYGIETTIPWGISISDPVYRYHPINVYQLILLIPIIWMMFKLPIGKGRMASIGLTGYGMSLLFVSLLKPKLSAWLNLSVEQWLAICFIAAGFFVWKQTRSAPLRKEL